MKKIFLIVMLTIAGVMVAMAQDIDSLLAAARANPDTAVINRLYEVGYEVEWMNDIETAKRIYLTANELSKKIDYPVGRIKFASNFTGLLNLEGLFDSSLVINQQALVLARKINNEERINKQLLNIGNVYLYKRLYQTAFDYYFQAIPYFEKAGNKKNLARIYDLMQLIYSNMGQADQGVVYGEKALALMSDMPDDIQRGDILCNLSISYNKMYPPRRKEQFDCLTEALRIAKLNNYLYLQINALSNISNYYMETYNYLSAEPYIREALKISEEIEHPEGQCTGMRGMAYIEMYKGNYKKSEEWIRKVLALAQEYQFISEEHKCYVVLAELVLLTDRDYTKHQRIVDKQDSIAQLILNDKVFRATEEQKIKYETEKKEMQIASMQAEHKLLIWLSIAGGVILLLTVFALIFRQVWLKKRTQLIATQAVLDGETQERVRLARDLHDGLGGMLSAVKMNLYEMKNENYILERHDVGIFEKALDMLDRSVGELRRVAHHLMPESLVNNGLRISLEDFCRAIPNAHFGYFGNDGRLDNHLELMLYHCAYELINNAIKHAQAKNINVQLQIANHSVSLTVSDDGIGFDSEKAVKGAGLDNIRQRVMSYNGKFHIDSEPNKGTEAIIDIESLK